MDIMYFFMRRKRMERERPLMCLEQRSGRDQQVEEQDEHTEAAVVLPAISPPNTPAESMDFLSRSWTLSACEISRVLLAGNKKRGVVTDDSLRVFVVPDSIHLHPRNGAAIGKWLQHVDLRKGRAVSKEKARMARARIHAALSVAGVAAAVAAEIAVMSSESQGSKTASALASATELLASHCVEVAEMAGSGHQQIADAIRSAVDVRTPGDLITLTAAAATALRGVAALKQRVQREARSNFAAVIPYEKGTCCSPEIWCKEGDLLKRNINGTLNWKRVSLHINNKPQVIIKIKSKHIGGALSKKKRSVVYGVCDKELEWPGMEISLSFGLKTAEGNMVFKCSNWFSKQKWVDAVKNLLRQVGWSDGDDRTEKSMEPLKLG